MEKSNSDCDYLERVVEQLDATAMSRLDFDELKDRLSTIRDRLTANDRLASEHACLREEYQQRISGMVKAIAAVDRKRDRLEEAVALIDELPKLPAERLLETYRKVAARFRDCFPGSFGSYPVSTRVANQTTAVER